MPKIIYLFCLCTQLTNSFEFNYKLAPDREQYPMHYHAFFGDCQTIEELDSSGDYLLDQADLLERTPLHYAALNGHYQAVLKLLELGAETFVLDRTHRLPEQLALINGYVDLSKYLKAYRKAHR